MTPSRLGTPNVSVSLAASGSHRVFGSPEMVSPVSAYVPLPVSAVKSTPNHDSRAHHQQNALKIEQGDTETNSTSQNERIDVSPPSCRCSEPEVAVQRTVTRDNANKGRLFWVCAKPRNAQCNFFEWDDEVRKDIKRILAGPSPTRASPSKVRRLSPGLLTVVLEEIGTLSTTVTETSISPDFFASLTSISGATAQNLDGFNQSKVTFPLAELDNVVDLASRHHLRYACSLPQSVINRLRAHARREKALVAAQDVVTRGPEEILPPSMCEKIMEFQWGGIRFALRRGGRCLIGDDMGLGKTLQAIAVARIYRKDWPLLIVCPSSLRLNWKEELLTWLGEDIDASEINVVMKGSDCDRRFEAVNIVSYELVQKVSERQLRRCNFVIADESHYLKSTDSKRTKFLTPIIRDMPRALLLSGTPALSRPVELFSQINALEPDLFPSYHEFTERYCNAHKTRWGWDVSGSANLGELHILLRGSCLIRRRKDDVLTQLPPKQRQVVWVEPKPSVMKDVKKAQQELLQAQAALDQASTEGEALMCSNAFRAANNKLYTLTGEAKLDAVKQFLKDTLEGSGKLIVFGHHREVLTSLNEFVMSKLKVDTILIDGNTPQAARQGLCHDFQNIPKCRAAILSITAAGVGLTLTAATVVIFAELYWNPGSLLQAEDRAHRIGQRDCVLVKYLLARETLDESMWSTVRKKLTVVGKSLTGTAAQMAVVGDSQRPTGNCTIDKFFHPREDTSAIEDILNSPQDSSAFEDVTPVRNILETTDPDIQNRIQSSSLKCNGIIDLEIDDPIFPLEIQSTGLNAVGHAGAKHLLDADLALARALQQHFDAEAAVVANFPRNKVN
jgi:SWI/SNF-related matrix-associated actin-dependent regulator of chromatin subfamily A-like protein 1